MLELAHVTAGYGPIVVLRDIDLHVDEGTAVCVLGPNGAGKTTTMRTIAGLIRPRSGEVRLDGVRIDRLPPDRIVRLGLSMVPERREVFPFLTVAENLRMGAFARHDRGAVHQDFEQVVALFPRLEERLSQPAGTLSGGEQQMLAIGRALMARPRLLLLDEPSQGLAPVLVQQVFQSIADIRTRGTALLVVEQNARMALSLTDRAYVLESGRIVLEGESRTFDQDTTVRDTYLGQV